MPLGICPASNASSSNTPSTPRQISGNHRVSDNPEDVARVERAGGIIAQSDIDGVVAGPFRVWPGGLMMTRSIGDASAGEVSRACHSG